MVHATAGIDGYDIQEKRRVIVKLHEGKNREIRELFRSVNVRVTRLRRFRIGIVTLRALSQGAYRDLTSTEIQWFLKRGKKHDSRH